MITDPLKCSYLLRIAVMFVPLVFQERREKAREPDTGSRWESPGTRVVRIKEQLEAEQLSHAPSQSV